MNNLLEELHATYIFTHDLKPLEIKGRTFINIADKFRVNQVLHWNKLSNPVTLH